MERERERDREREREREEDGGWSTLLNSSKSAKAMHASHALFGSQLRVFSSPSFLGPLCHAVSKRN